MEFFMKIATVIGTRPEIIKMAPVLDEIEKMGIDNILIHTGQHYDHEMSQQFFQDLKIKKPDYNIGVGSNSHGKQTAIMMESIENVLIAEKPDVIMVQGDTNAVLAGALTASKLHMAVGHVEAGLRSYDKTMPEEINRQIADICSNIFFVPTEESAINLLFENINPHEIYITGNTIVDACYRHLKIAEVESNILNELQVTGDILILTIHRAENVDDPKRLKNIVDALLELNNITVIFPVHPRTAKTLKKFGFYDTLENAPHIKIIKPLGYLDFLLLLSKSKFVMTDSGGLQEEAITLNIPCITLRYNTERPETVKAGGNILVGTDKDMIVDAYIRISTDSTLYQKMKNAKNPYGNGQSSKNIIKAVISDYNCGKFDINLPEHVKSFIGREVLRIQENITVSGYEEIHPGSTVNMIFMDNKIKFPYPDVNLKDKNVLINKFKLD
jgi:UDP-N-acetylglucosamine 2-epimerase (non-hydrolysing)